ncbi:MAG TPA: PAS domain-containing protein, partial [Chitinophagaceae bacterium]|nr:PAS domain-containing protein [Chitinophagaceae bacterium]
MKETLFEKVPCGIFSFFDDNSILEFNQTLKAFLQLEDENLEGKNVETILTIPSRIFFQTHFFPLLKLQEHTEEIFITLLSKNGEHFPVLLNAKRIQWEDRMLNCCVCIHVPNRKRFEDEIVAARKTAEKALHENSELIKAKVELQLYTERLEKQMRLVSKQNKELQQFNHTVTHNLKEPLRKIIFYANRGLENQSSPDLQKLNRSIHQMRNVVLGLQRYVWLDESRRKIEKLDLNKIIQNTEIRLKDELEEPFLIKTENLCDIFGDKEQIEVLFFELFSNAVKFKKNDTAEITVSCTIIKQNKFKEVEGKYS